AALAVQVSERRAEMPYLRRETMLGIQIQLLLHLVRPDAISAQIDDHGELLSVVASAGFSTTTSLICRTGVMPVKLRISARIYWACGPNVDWYASTESHIRWHMATYGAAASGVAPVRPLSMV